MKSNYGSTLVSSLSLPIALAAPVSTFAAQSVASVVLAKRTNRRFYALSAQSAAFRYGKAIGHACKWRNRALAYAIRGDTVGAAQCRRFMRETSLRAIGYLSLLPSQDY